jgi:hypothetical protein
MMLSLFLLCSLSYSIPLLKCSDINDKDKRPFTDLRPIILDVDNDGTLDTIIPRVYSVEMNRLRRGGNKRTKQTHWITFDITMSKGRTLKSFYRYQYGSDLADYWVYAFVSCKQHGPPVLVFFSGDDTTDETVVLRYRHGRFVVQSRKIHQSEI